MFRRTFLKIAASCVIVPALRWTEPFVVPRKRQPMTLTWVGGESNRWDDPRCWAEGVCPQDGDSVLICGGVLASGPSAPLNLERVTITDNARLELWWNDNPREIDSIELIDGAWHHQGSMARSVGKVEGYVGGPP